jgi:hypothetical protein
LDLAENQIRIDRPNEWFGIFVALVQIVEHGFLKRANSRMTAATDAAFRQLPEEPFHQFSQLPLVGVK